MNVENNMQQLFFETFSFSLNIFFREEQNIFNGCISL